jgi:hypothetical protein
MKLKRQLPGESKGKEIKIIRPSAPFLIASFVLYTNFLFLLGCTMYGVTKVSGPSLADADKNQVTFEDDILKFPEISISVKPQNYYVSFFSIGPVIPIAPIPTVGDPPITRKGLNFELVIQMETKSEGYMFNPEHIEIEHKNTKYKPISHRGPYIGGGQLREVKRTIPGHKWDCVRPEGGLHGQQLYPVSGKVCFEIEFPIQTLSPEEEFRVTVGGIVKDEKPLHAPVLFFRPTSRGGLTIMG